MLSHVKNSTYEEGVPKTRLLLYDLVDSFKVADIWMEERSAGGSETSHTIKGIVDGSL
jgi:hypothetical protein